MNPESTVLINDYVLDFVDVQTGERDLNIPFEWILVSVDL